MRCAAVRNRFAAGHQARRPWRKLGSVLFAGLLALTPGADAKVAPKADLTLAPGADAAVVPGADAATAHRLSGASIGMAARRQEVCRMAKVPVRAVAARVRGDAPLSPVVVHALCVASEKAHADPFLLLAMAWEESRFNPRAINRFSSARGLLQFTTTTWLTVVRDFGAQYGLGKLAAAIHTGRDGRIWVSSPAVRATILRLRDDPELEAIMAAESLDQQRTALRQAVGRALRPADLYLLHLLGPAGAEDFLRRLARTPNARSVDVIGREAAHNTALFRRHGRWLTLSQTYADLRQTLKEQVELHAGLFAPAG